MKTITFKKISLVLAASGVAALAPAQTNNLPDQPPQNQSWPERVVSQMTAQQFVTDAAMGGMKEVRLSELALENSQNKDVKTFAHRMITDHSAANQKLMQLAQAKGLDLPNSNTFATNDPNWNNPMITGSEQIKAAYLLKTNLALAAYQDFKQLKALANSGREFDLAYAHDMVLDHVNTVMEFEAASRLLTDPELKAFAQQTLPTLREHSKMARQLLDKVNGEQAGTQPAETNMTAGLASSGR